MVCKAKHVSGADVVPGTSVGGLDTLLECCGELVKKIITTGPAIRFWLNTTFVQYQSINIKALACWLFMTDIQTHLWLFYLWHCCSSPTRSWVKVGFQNLNQNQNIVFSLNASIQVHGPAMSKMQSVFWRPTLTPAPQPAHSCGVSCMSLQYFY